MVLHEYYFDNLKSGGGTGDPNRTAQFAKAAESSFGSYEIWKADFVGIGKMRGVGWPFVIRIRRTAGSQTTGSRSMKLEMLRASIQFW